MSHRDQFVRNSSAKTRSAQSAELSVGVAFVNARVAPLWIAEKEGFFKKNGIEPKILKLAGGTQ